MRSACLDEYQHAVLRYDNLFLFCGNRRVLVLAQGFLDPPLAALTFAAQSIICAFGLAAAAPRSPYRHLELCGIALTLKAGQKRDCFCPAYRL